MDAGVLPLPDMSSGQTSATSCAHLMGKALSIYLMSGNDTPALAEAAVAGGADLLELGFPFSDPLADGPVIRRAGERALAAGMRTQRCLEVLRETRERLGPNVPLIPMTYASLLEAYGWERFAADARAAGATSVIVADLPAGERPELEARAARRADLDGRAHRPRGARDRRLALPRHRDGHHRRARRRLPRARGSGRPRARRRSRRPALRRLRNLDARSRPAPPPTSRTAIVVGTRAVEVADEGADALDEVRSQPARRAGRVGPLGRVQEAAGTAAFFPCVPEKGALCRSILPILVSSQPPPGCSRVWREQWRLVTIGLTCALATTGLSLAIPILIRHAIDNSIAPTSGARIGVSGRTSPRSSSSAVVRFCTNFTRRYATSRVGIRIEARMRELLYQAYLRFPRAFYDQHATGQVVSRATNDLYPIRYFIGWGMVQGAQSLMMIIGVAVVLLLVNPRLAVYARTRDAARRPARVAVRAQGDAGLAARPAAEGERDRGRGRSPSSESRWCRRSAARTTCARASATRRAPSATAIVRQARIEGSYLPGTAVPADRLDRDRPLPRRPRRDPRQPDAGRVLPLLLAAAPARLAARGARLDHQPRPARRRLRVAQLRLARADRRDPGAEQPRSTCPTAPLDVRFENVHFSYGSGSEVLRGVDLARRAPARSSRSAGRPAPARRRCSTCCRASTTRRAAACSSAASTRVTFRSRSCVPPSRS